MRADISECRVTPALALTDTALQEGARAGPRIKGWLGASVVFGLFLASLGLPPVIYFYLARWQPIARGILVAILLTAITASLVAAAFNGRGSCPRRN